MRNADLIKPTFQVGKGSQACDKPVVTELTLFHVRTTYMFHVCWLRGDFVDSLDGTRHVYSRVEVRCLTDIKHPITKPIQTVALVRKVPDLVKS
ncbi:hypothetical protein BFJ63_vAg15850 [Fusarium oxysporum f. sp. narcissi]|uniref:Uncharacterized protein n=1 Tax=Fusarium oxysporum f. sp. narcissi TaxID=451672 RepID=A0A4Q2V4L1_FUSOX|nr:hypothetical protein BFJ63_vAg15850 [Fusarium oxysporum f. sp. narcissi]